MIELNALVIYLMSVLDTLNFITSFVVALCFLVAFIICIMIVVAPYYVKEDFIKATINYFKMYSIIFIVSSLLCLFIPSKNTMFAMIIIPPITKNEQLQQLPDNVLTFINNYLQNLTTQKDSK